MYTHNPTFSRKMFREGVSALRAVKQALETYEYPLSEPALIIDWDKDTILAFDCKYDAQKYCERQYSKRNGNDLEIVVFLHEKKTQYTATYPNTNFFATVNGSDFYRDRKRIEFLEITEVHAQI